MEEIKINIPEGYKVFRIDDDNKIVLTKKQPQYPKTYKECCDILDVLENINMEGYKKELLLSFQQLLICRGAYWKIAGEEMELGKPWEPDWSDEIGAYYTISYDGINIKCYNCTDVYSKLAFPTEKMRNVFYENFKDLIESCKGLL